MGYARGVRGGHAGGHLREPALDLVEAIWHRDANWWQVDAGDGEPFTSPEAAYRHLGRLWHCSDTVPSTYRSLAEDLVGEGRAWSYASLARHLRMYIVRDLHVRVSHR